MTPEQPRRRHDASRHCLGSDASTPLLPEILSALVAANEGHHDGYGADVYTLALGETVRAEFGPDATVHPVLTGSGANLVSLEMLVPRWGAVICPATAHINTDECGAPEKLAGVKVLPVATGDGKLVPRDIEVVVSRSMHFRHARPSAVSVSQTTELGTVYSVAELRELADCAHEHGLALHVDGARLFNAAAALDVPLRAVTSDVGVDVLSLGCTKHGALAAEVVVVLDRSKLVSPIDPAYLQKLTCQLHSKTRFTSVQVLTLLEGELWRRGAQQANVMAARLAEGLSPHLAVVWPHANAVFARIDERTRALLNGRVTLSFWDEREGLVRWMCSFDTKPEHVERLVLDVQQALARTTCS